MKNHFPTPPQAPLRRKCSTVSSSVSRATTTTVLAAKRRSRPVSTYFNRIATRLNMNKQLRRSSLALHRINSKKGHEGFEDLKQFIKQGGEFTKELVSVLHERAELEIQYARGLAKLSSKLFKLTKDFNGTVSNAWHFIAEDMEASADTHKSISNLFVEDLVKPLKLFCEAQHKTRKAMESMVERRAKTLNEWRGTEGKTKVKCYNNCRDNEKVQDQLLDCKLGRGRVLSDKELVKLETKRKKSEETVRKSDLDYYACCLKAERARLEWETAVLKGSTVFRQMEHERLQQLKNVAEHYHVTMAEHRPKLVLCSQRLDEPIQNCHVEGDMETVRQKVEIDLESLGDQILPSFYAEDQTNAMNTERRRESLAKFLRVIKSDIDRENKGKAGVENLAKALKETPKFGGEDSQQDVQDKLQHMKSMLTFMEACRFKLLNSLLDLEGRPPIDHPLNAFIAISKDKSGMLRTQLRIPYNARQEIHPPVEYNYPPSPSHSPSSSSSLSLVPDTLDRGMADGGFSDMGSSDYENHKRSPTHDHHVQNGHDQVEEDGISSEFDDFSDGEPVNIIEVVNGRHNGSNLDSTGNSVAHNSSTENEVNEIYIQEKIHTVPSLGTCKAIYDYMANMYDELTIRVGDVINIHDKQEDGWWLGELNGTVGIFPATYVEESDEST